MMRIRTLAALAACAVLPTLQSCTARYQELLRDRDAEIAALESKLMDSSEENRRLREMEEAAQARAADLQKRLTSGPREASTSKIADDIGGNVNVRYSNGRLKIGIENTVTFSSGSTKLKPEASQVLQRVANVIRRDFPNRRIYVEGHTDTDPIQKTKNLYRHNRHLSAERADAVASWLVDKGGVPGKQVVVVGFGPHDPVSSAADKARNRRVEIVVGDLL